MPLISDDRQTSQGKLKELENKQQVQFPYPQKTIATQDQLMVAATLSGWEAQWLNG